MASAKPQAPTAVLRIKRKRTEDSFNALLVHTGAKKRKEDVPSENTQCLFTFAGTVANQRNIDHHRKIVEQLNTKDLYKQIGLNEKLKTTLRKQKKENQQISRYKVLSEARGHISDANEEKTYDDEIDRLYKVYDVISDSKEVESKTSLEQKTNKTDESVDDILCNSVKMIRENLSITDSETTKDDYVYDIYFAQSYFQVDNNNVLDIEGVTEEMLMCCDQTNDNDEFYDDEDDENAEDNWRNDYPDEDEYPSSGNEDGHRGDYSSGDEDFVYGDYRSGNGRIRFDPYTAEYNPDDYYDTVADDYNNDDM